MSLRSKFIIFYKNLKILFKYYKKFLFSIIIMSVMGGLFPLVTLFITSKLIDEIVSNLGFNNILFWAIVSIVSIFVINLIQKFFNTIYVLEMNKRYLTYNKIWRDINNKTDFKDIEDANRIEEIESINRVQMFTGKGIIFIMYSFDSLIKSLVLIIGGIVLTFPLLKLLIENSSYINYIIILFLGLISLSIIINLIESYIQKTFSKFIETGTKGNSSYGFYGYNMNEKERSIDVRLFNQSEIAYTILEEDTTFLPKGELDNLYVKVFGTLGSVVEFLSGLQLFSIYLFLLYIIYQGIISIGQFTQFSGAMIQFVTGFTLFSKTFYNMLINSEYSNKVINFIENDDTIYKGSLTTEKRDDNKYEIEFKNVSFRYPNTDEYILKNINTKFELGKRLAIVGQNGSGKTTFIKLLIRLYDPDKGQILLNGIDIKKYDYKDYIKIFSVVFQDYSLFAYPISQNIAGNMNYDKDKINSVINDVGMTERISNMKHGIDTYISKQNDDEGVDLSGGESQKIAIARALYKDSAFIILDEPTATLDPLAEQEIYEKMGNIVNDKTAIFISHRLSSCKMSDNILVFDNGEIVQEGNHNSLVNNDGKYKELWDAQAQYYI